jgi:uroporphyrinogen-III synthase
MDQKGQIWITKSLSEQQKACAQNSGLEVKEIALTKIQYLEFPKDLPEAEAWIFTSQNAVKNLSQTPFNGRVYASGKQTANVLKEKGFETKSGDSETAQSLAELIAEDGVKSALFFCGNIRRNELPNYLAKKGVQLKEKVVYHTLLDPKKIPSQKGDALFFMSPSAVESFAMMNEFDTDLNYFSIGETTASSLRKKGVQKINTAKEASFEAMLEQYKTNKKWSSRN